jgi:hypothetical protein
MRSMIALSLVVTIAGGCSAPTRTGGHGGSGGGGNGVGGSSQIDLGAPPPPDLAPPGPANDFPPTPIIDNNAPANAPTLFGPPTSGMSSGGPCLTQPPIGALLPENFLRPRFDFKAVGGQNLFEIRLHTSAEANDLVVYTTQTSWTLPGAVWQGLATHTDVPITVTVRGAVYSGSALTAGPSLGSSGDITIAPAAAPGAIVYWAQVSSTKATSLKGFSFGSETPPATVITPNQVAPNAQCVACHASTPDGTYAGFSWTATNADGRPSQIGLFTTDGNATPPSFVTASMTLQGLLATNGATLPVFTKAHWAPSDRLMIWLKPTGAIKTNGDFPGYAIMATNLEATMPMAAPVVNGDPAGKLPGAPAISHDGKTIAYALGSSDGSGYQMTDGDLRIVPYNGTAGGNTSTLLGGAHDANRNEYFPSFSPDDKYIAFTSAPSGPLNYTPNNAPAEVFVVNADSSSTTPVRLAANDPPTCSGVTSPGITNSWPKWAPDATTVGTRTFYWLTFSSKRNDMMTPQLFVTPVVLDGGTLKTYPALYLWNQPATEGNHTPAWDNFKIPIS